MLKANCQKYIAIIIKHGTKKKKKRTKREGKTHCFSCRYFTDNVNRKKVTMTNEEIREKLKCFNCNHKKSKFLN